MRIIIVGDGKMGSTFAQRLSKAGHDVTIIDKRATALQHTIESLDIMAIEGNGTTLEIQREAGVEQADLLIAATNTDEQNLLTCLIAKRAGAKHTIARVRSPEYVKEISLIQEDLGLSLTINPELACATEMARVLRFPSAVKIDTFTGGRVEILKHCLSPNSPLVGIRLSELSRFKASVLICAVERGKEVFIPNGSFQLAARGPDQHCGPAPGRLPVFPQNRRAHLTGPADYASGWGTHRLLPGRTDGGFWRRCQNH